MLACICVGGCWRMPIESLADQREGSTIIHRFLPCMQPNSLIFCTQFSELACCTPSQDQQNLDYIKVIFGWLFFSFLSFFFFFFFPPFGSHAQRVPLLSTQHLAFLLLFPPCLAHFHSLNQHLSLLYRQWPIVPAYW